MIDLGDSILTPGLVNAHTHLDLSHLEGQVPYTGKFTDWVSHLVQQRNSLNTPAESIITIAAENSLKNGVTLVGDISYNNSAATTLAKTPIRKTLFAEVFGLGSTLDIQENYLKNCVPFHHSDPLYQQGLSPHAPYSCGPDLYTLTAQIAQKHHLPLTTHLAETLDEHEFLTHGTGPWKQYLQKINRFPSDWRPPSRSPVSYFLQLPLSNQPFLLAHVNYISDEELTALAHSPHHVAYCPRSHRYFQHPPHRFNDMIKAGINVCLGTDSLASNASLSILAEMQYLHQHLPSFPPDTLLKMATLNGARALNWHNKTGSITPGKEADIIAIQTPETTTPPHRAILHPNATVIKTMVRGIFSAL
ncbi:MAG: amidohydrolase family protein [Phycisphaerae bacterium]|nr:amidohydrolase family protein [Phycisphaerae bacterium]